MTDLPPLLPVTALIATLALAYCAITFTDAASFSLRQAQTATGDLTLSAKHFDLGFQTQRLSPHGRPPVRVLPKRSQTARSLSLRKVQHR